MTVAIARPMPKPSKWLWCQMGQVLEKTEAWALQICNKSARVFQFLPTQVKNLRKKHLGPKRLSRSFPQKIGIQFKGVWRSKWRKCFARTSLPITPWLNTSQTSSLKKHVVIHSKSTYIRDFLEGWDSQCRIWNLTISCHFPLSWAQLWRKISNFTLINWQGMVQYDLKGSLCNFDVSFKFILRSKRLYCALLTQELVKAWFRAELPCVQKALLGIHFKLWLVKRLRGKRARNTFALPTCVAHTSP